MRNSSKKNRVVSDEMFRQQLGCVDDCNVVTFSPLLCTDKFVWKETWHVFFSGKH